ncbi:MAG: class I SAM-dependent methyltransferase [Solirubrobacteraceae bacterium]
MSGARQGSGGTDAIQDSVNRYFDSTSSYWDDIYAGSNLQGVIYQQRQRTVLELVDEAAAGERSHVLEIGCGAGHLTVQLAERGMRIDAVDASAEMVAATSARAARAGLDGAVDVQVADVHSLPFPSESFDLVVAVGVIPWLHSARQAVAEMGRVLRPGGELVLTADNRARLLSFTDPRAMLALSPLKRAYELVRRRRGQAASTLHYPRQVDRYLRHAALEPQRRQTVGFGPFAIFGRPLFANERSLQINRRMQELADRGGPLRWTGWHYVVRAKRH